MKLPLTPPSCSTRWNHTRRRLNTILPWKGKALANRLLVEADQQGFPLSLLSEPTEATARLDWRARYSQALVEVLGQVEHQWSRPTGFRYWLQGAIVLLADWLPLLTLGGVA